MSLNWNKLRTWNGSQQTAFEKLCCQLYGDEEPSKDSVFIVKGSGGDAGVECYWQLSNGNECALQAKFFLSPPNVNQWSQIDASVQVALDKHPNIVRYTICLPVDRSDARDRKTKKSFLEKWNEHVLKWKNLTSNNRVNVEFQYWGEHEIFNRLMTGTRGRLYFWFNEETFDNDWFLEKMAQAIGIAGPRYTPTLNIELPVAKIFDGLGRTHRFFATFQEIHKRLRAAFNNYSLQKSRSYAPDRFVQFEESVIRLFTILSDVPGTNLSNTIEFPNLESVIGECRQLNHELSGIVLAEIQRVKQARRDQTAETSDQSLHDDFAPHYYREIGTSLDQIASLIQSPMSRLANTPYLILSGQAGSGKTHLFCDVANSRIESGLPTIVIMGETLTASEEPWQQLIRELHLSISVDEFLGALNTVAQLKNTRALILIDAINESEGLKQWPSRIRGMVTKLKGFTYLALGLSIRTPYDKFILPDELVESGELIKQTHEGFAGLEYKAVQVYFDHFGIEQPSVPLLNPEFSNPLFLKLICQGLANQHLTRLPTGFGGVTKILSFFVDSANRKIAERLDYNPNSPKVQNAIEDLVKVMIARGERRVPQADAENIVNQHWDNNTYRQSLYYQMLAEGVISQVGYEDADSLKEYTRFSFDRFADHLITKHILDQQADIEASFQTGQELHSLLTGHARYSLQYALISGLSVQLPEKIGKELIEVAPYFSDDWRAREAFTDSLIWRKWADSGEIPDKVIDLINQFTKSDQQLDDKILQTLLSVTLNPTHPLNADFLHRNLMRFSLAERDAWWSVFLSQQYAWSESAHDPVKRLLDWVLSRQNTSRIDSEALRLAGLTLSWFLTTSNRYLRDRATKAMVCLFTHQTKTLLQIIPQFLEVNDLYIIERLFAVAYGCAMRCQDDNAIIDLANSTYQWIFACDEPPPHLLLRCYARSIIELALQKHLNVDVEVKRIRPPYNSSWIDEPASEKELKDQYGNYWEDMPNGERSRLTLHSSVMGWGDFARYIVESRVHYWTSRKFNEPYKPSAKELYENFISSLTEKQQGAWQNVHAVLEKARFAQIQVVRDMDAKDEPESIEDNMDLVDSTETMAEAEQSHFNDYEEQLNNTSQLFIATLGKRKLKLLEQQVIPYLNGSLPAYEEDRFDASLAQRWILQKVFDMGWTTERFGEFDWRVNYFDASRDAKKAERIGKKYQWIALNEFLARLADNFVFKGESWTKEKGLTYQGSWQIGMRELDPSSLITQTNRRAWGDYPLNWWFTEEYSDWQSQFQTKAWLASPINLPDVPKLIDIVRPSNGSTWLALQGFYEWQEAIPPIEEKYERTRRQLWYMLKSYIVKKADKDAYIKWGNQQDFMGRWMPESNSLYDVFLGEFYWAAAFDYFRDSSGDYQDWSEDYRGRLPVSICVTADEYSNEDHYDCSIEDNIHILTPSRWLAQQMRLHWNSREGEFIDHSGDLVVLDPTVEEAGPQVLLMNKENLLSFLNLNGYEIVWTLLGEKQLIGGGTNEMQSSGYMKINGVYHLEEGEVVGQLRAKYFSPNIG